MHLCNNEIHSVNTVEVLWGHAMNLLLQLINSVGRENIDHEIIAVAFNIDPEFVFGHLVGRSWERRSMVDAR